MNDRSRLLAARGSLGRTVALIVNERIVDATFDIDAKTYYLKPLIASTISPRERLVFSGTLPFRVKHNIQGKTIVPGLLTESNITIDCRCLQQKHSTENDLWINVDDCIDAAKVIEVLCRWTAWNQELATVFQDRIRCSESYLADAYHEDRACPTLMTSYIDWEQSIAEANINPLHKCRMPFESATQPSKGYDFKHTHIAFLVIRRNIIRIFGPLEAQLSPLLKLANIDESAIDKDSEMIVPVHDFQVSYLLSRPDASDILRVLPQKVPALAQASTRSMTIPGLPGLCVKLSLSIFIGDALRTINHKSAFNAVHYWSSGMLDTKNVVGLRDAPVEIFPEVACGNAMQDHLAVMIRWDAYHESRPSVPEDVGYAVTGALAEPAVLGQPGCVAAAMFNLSSKTERMAFLSE
jgi:hypothetical protein